ncbi:hypothetical protein K443DRAFT_3992 [Laccaria amethystina LaAM-08-1]|uniref:Uncharacterized protein n=1 Tax=Laccaria amethystina LaAM-08-1 TaxID=1095629 RepID=A0A0C9WZT7_9AGAR|nr:hypothetical protein K443DRAFT_3992 [Laccaria amethystina LaAM-08-1]
MLYSKPMSPGSRRYNLGFSEYLNVVYVMETSTGGSSNFNYIQEHKTTPTEFKPRISDSFGSTAVPPEPISSPPIYPTTGYTHPRHTRAHHPPLQ